MRLAGAPAKSSARPFDAQQHALLETHTQATLGAAFDRGTNALSPLGSLKYKVCVLCCAELRAACCARCVIDCSRRRMRA